MITFDFIRHGLATSLPDSTFSIAEEESVKAANETDLSGGTTVRNVYVGSTQLAREDSSGNWSYFLHDHLGTTRMTLNASGAVTNDVDYYPYGGLAYSSGSTTNLYGFTGYETDGESQTNYAVFRNESPTLGRFLSPNPYGDSYDLSDPQSLNRYSYVGNRPLIYVDPTRLTCQEGEEDNGDGTVTIIISDDGDGKGCAAAGVGPGDPYTGDGSTSTWQDLNPGEGDTTYSDGFYAIGISNFVLGVTLPPLPTNNFDPNDPTYQLAKTISQQDASLLNGHAEACFLGGSAIIGAAPTVLAYMLETEADADLVAYLYQLSTNSGFQARVAEAGGAAAAGLSALAYPCTHLRPRSPSWIVHAKAF